MSVVKAALSLAVVSILAGTTEPSRAADAAPKSVNVIEFVTHPKNSNGQVVCGLFVKKGWLNTPIKPAWAKIRQNTAVCIFRDVEPGTYAISAYHDENKNGKLDTNSLGMPTEDYCASRDARESFSAPQFEKARFAYSGGKVRMSATLK